MVYRLGRRRATLKHRLGLAAGLLLAFTAGSITTAVLFWRFYDSLPSISIRRVPIGLKENSGRRKPVHVANAPVSPENGSSTTSQATLGQNVQHARDIRLTDCSADAPRSFSGVSSPQLIKLAEYEQMCPGLIRSVSFFIGTPTTIDQAQGQAAWIADVLKQFSSKHITPLVFMEPASNGVLLDAVQYRDGAFDAPLDAFFAELKARGIGDNMMGTWVPWPEGNIPVWTSVDPALFAANVAKTVQIQKKHFPNSKAAVLLESKTYPHANSWEGGKYVSLVPFIESIPKGLIDSFGLQGFAWPPTAPNEAPMLDPEKFLRIDLAAQAARTLGVQEIWFNTGVFAASYVVSKANPYILSPEQRQSILDGIVAQAKRLKGQGLAVSVHLFAQDKSKVGEAIDWSFWQPGQQATSASAPVLKTFFGDLKQSAVGVWLFDS